MAFQRPDNYYYFKGNSCEQIFTERVLTPEKKLLFSQHARGEDDFGQKMELPFKGICMKQSRNNKSVQT